MAAQDGVVSSDCECCAFSSDNFIRLLFDDTIDLGYKMGLGHLDDMLAERFPNRLDKLLS